MAGCLVYSSIASTRSGVGLGARGATRVKLGPPNSGINSMRSRAAARDTTPERAGVSEISRVAGRATLSFSVVSKPNVASKYAFESSRRDLHNSLLCTVLQSQFFRQKSPKLFRD